MPSKKTVIKVIKIRADIVLTGCTEYHAYTRKVKLRDSCVFVGRNVHSHDYYMKLYVGKHTSRILKTDIA